MAVFGGDDAPRVWPRAGGFQQIAQWAHRVWEDGRASSWRAPQRQTGSCGEADRIEGPDDLHGSESALGAAGDVDAPEAQKRVADVGGRGLRGLGAEPQQRAADGKIGGLRAVGKQAEVPDAHETPRQDVKQKTPDELLGGQGAPFHYVAILAVAPGEGDLPPETSSMRWLEMAIR